MNQQLKTRMTHSCPVLKDMVAYLEAREAKSATVGAGDVNIEQTVEFPSTSRLVSFMFVNLTGAEEGIDVYDITTSGFKFKAGSAGTLYYKIDEVSA